MLVKGATGRIAMKDMGKSTDTKQQNDPTSDHYA